MCLDVVDDVGIADGVVGVVGVVVVDDGIYGDADRGMLLVVVVLLVLVM